MKKIILLCVAVMTIMGFNSAAAQFKASPISKKSSVATEVKSRATDTFVFGYCGEYSNGIGTGKEGEIGAAIEIPADKAAVYSGSKVTKLQIGIGQPCAPTTINIFVSEGFDQEPVYLEEVKITKIDGWNEFTLKTPYEISDKGFVVGYKVVPLSSKDYPIGVDAQPSTSGYGDWVYVNSKWMRLYDPEIGGVCIRAVLEGENFPVVDLGLNSISLPAFVKSGEEFSITGEVMNMGVNDVKSFEVAYQVGDAAPATKTIEIEPLANKGKYMFEIPGVVYNGNPKFNAELKATVTKVNGVEDLSPADNQASTLFWTSGYSFERVVVVEEGTGTWCGYCPMGIVSLEALSKLYPDSFIGIAVHGNDIMEAASYIDDYPAENFPICHINRYYYNQTPSPEYLEIFYNAEHQRHAFGDVNIKNLVFNEDKSMVNVTTELKFAVNAKDVEFRLAYVLLENGVGPYNQTNYYANNALGEMGGWEKKSSPVKTMYNDVARDIFSYYGIENSVETNIVEGKKYEHTYDLSLKNVGNIKKMDIVVLLLDYNTGEILNAKKFTAENIAGISEIEAEQNVPAVFYNLQGMEVDADKLVPGIYVKRAGNKAEKVVIR